MRYFVFLLILIILPALSLAQKPVVFVTIPPQAAFVERIAGGAVEVRTMVEAGQDPHTFEPGAKQLAALSGARLYIRAGIPFEEPMLERLRGGAFAELKIVDMREGVTMLAMDEHDHEGHDHSESEDGLDPHIWLAPKLVKIQARNIAGALMEAVPEGSRRYTIGLDRFEKELDALDARLADKLTPARGKTMMVYHPSWGYFCEAYGLRQMAVESEGKTPGAKQLIALSEAAKAENITTIFVQPQFSARSAEAIGNAIGGGTVAIDPLARDWVANLEAVADKVVAALETQTLP